MDKILEQKYVKSNTFDPIARGFVIMDTLNNPQFPLNTIILDRTKFDSSTILREYRRAYNMTKAEIFMPWHFQVELVDREYIIQNTRPVNYKTPYKEWSEHICICLVGDSGNDIYMPDIYKKIANICIKPYTKSNVNQVPEKITYLTGKSFMQQQLVKQL